MLASMFAEPGADHVKVKLCVFDPDFQRLTVAVERALDVPADSFVDADRCLKKGAAMPCILLPQVAAAPSDGSTVSAKVRQLSSQKSEVPSVLVILCDSEL
jgi:hypothetical protein